MKYKINQTVYMLDEYSKLFVRKGVILGFYDISPNKRKYYVEFGGVYPVKYDVEEYLLFASEKECLQNEYNNTLSHLRQIKKELNKDKVKNA